MARRSPKLLVPALVVVGVAALVAVVYAPWYLNYDSRYALLWARDLTEGLTPAYTAPFAPTPHPGWNAVALLALPFGEGADDALAWVVMLSFGAVVWLVYALGAELFNRWVGVVAALVVLTRAAMLRDVVLAYLDVPFAALLLLAVLLEVRRPRRGAATLAVLAVAGLLRPESWVLAALYAAWSWRGATAAQRAQYAALVAVAPAIWLASDAIVTGDALHSLHGTAELAEENDRHRSLSDVPYWTAQYLGFTLRLPILAGAAVGIAFAWRHSARRWRVPLVVAALLVAGFAAGPIFGLPLIGRYMRTPSMLLAVFYGAGCLGWLALPPSRARTRWAIAGMASLAAGLAWMPSAVGRLDELRERRDREARNYGALRELARSDRLEAAFAACPDLSATDHKPVPYLRWWLEGDPGTVGTTEDASRPRGRIVVQPARSALQRNAYGEELPDRPPAAPYFPVTETRHWTAHALPECGP